MDSMFDGSLARSMEAGSWASSTWPRTNLLDAGNSLLVAAEVPGLTEKDIQLTLNQDVLSISGERKVVAPEGYSAHRQERRPVIFARSFALPCKVNPDKVAASVKNGILTVTLEKAADAMPRQIKIEPPGFSQRNRGSDKRHCTHASSKREWAHEEPARFLGNLVLTRWRRCPRLDPGASCRPRRLRRGR